MENGSKFQAKSIMQWQMIAHGCGLSVLVCSGLCALIEVKTTAGLGLPLRLDGEQSNVRAGTEQKRVCNSFYTRHFCPKSAIVGHIAAYCKSQNNDRVESALQSTTVNIVIKLHRNRV